MQYPRKPIPPLPARAPHPRRVIPDHTPKCYLEYLERRYRFDPDPRAVLPEWYRAALLRRIGILFGAYTPVSS